MITEPECTPAGVCILGRSRIRSQYFRFEPEQEPVSSEISDLLLFSVILLLRIKKLSLAITFSVCVA